MQPSEPAQAQDAQLMPSPSAGEGVEPSPLAGDAPSAGEPSHGEEPADAAPSPPSEGEGGGAGPEGGAGAGAPADEGADAAGDPPDDDRRTYKRKTLWANKLMRATLEGSDGQVEDVYLYLVDVSDGGMRINLDRSLEQGSEITLRFKLGTRSFSAHLRPVWQRCLPGDTWVVGLAFRDDERTNVESARQLTDYFSPQGRRQRFKLTETLVVSMQRDDAEVWYSLTTLDLSLTGLKARWDGELADNEIVQVKIFLRNYKNVVLRAQAMWQKKVGDERWEVGLRFLDPGESELQSLQDYIDESVGLKEQPKRSLF